MLVSEMVALIVAVRRSRRTFMLVCDRAAPLAGIGAFAAVTLGFFDHARREYRRRVIRGQVEDPGGAEAPATLQRKTDPAEHGRTRVVVTR